MRLHKIIGQIVISEPSDWITNEEALDQINRQIKMSITEGEIYRHVLYGHIKISIYFQSPFKLRKVTLSKNKAKLKPISQSLINRLCYLDSNAFSS